MRTRISSATKEVLIGSDLPTVLIGEGINPTGKKKLAAALQDRNMEPVCNEAIAQVQAGADILDINVGISDIDETILLPQAIQAVLGVVDVPLSIDSSNTDALEAALNVYQGKPIVNSVTGQEESLNNVLPLVKKYGAAVIGLTMDHEGISTDANQRVAIAHKIVDRAEAMGIQREDIIIDCLILTIATDDKAGLVTLEAIRRVKEELLVNQTLGASNVSFGLPNRDVLNNAFLALAIAAGVTCPTVNVAKVNTAVLATNLVLGRDDYAQRYIRAYRRQQP